MYVFVGFHSRRHHPMSGWKRSVLREQVLRVKFFRDYQRERTDNFKESINQQIREQRWLNQVELLKKRMISFTIFT